MWLGEFGEPGVRDQRAPASSKQSTEFGGYQYGRFADVNLRPRQRMQDQDGECKTKTPGTEAGRYKCGAFFTARYPR